MSEDDRVDISKSNAISSDISGDISCSNALTDNVTLASAIEKYRAEAINNCIDAEAMDIIRGSFPHDLSEKCVVRALDTYRQNRSQLYSRIDTENNTYELYTQEIATNQAAIELENQTREVRRKKNVKRAFMALSIVGILILLALGVLSCVMFSPNYIEKGQHMIFVEMTSGSLMNSGLWFGISLVLEIILGCVLIDIIVKRIKIKTTTYKSYRTITIVTLALLLTSGSSLLANHIIGNQACYGFNYSMSYTRELTIYHIDDNNDSTLNIPGVIRSINVDSVYLSSLADISDVKKIVFGENIITIKSKINGMTNNSVEEIILPQSLITIQDYAFNGFTAIKSIVIPPNVVEIQLRAFENCTALKSVFIPLSVMDVGSNIFGNVNNATIYVEASSKPSSWMSDWAGHNKVIFGAIKSDFDKNK